MVEVDDRETALEDIVAVSSDSRTATPRMLRLRR